MNAPAANLVMSVYNHFVLFFWICLSVSSLARESLKLSVTMCVLISAAETLTHPIYLGDEHNLSFHTIYNNNLEFVLYFCCYVLFVIYKKKGKWDSCLGTLFIARRWWLEFYLKANVCVEVARW